MVWMFIEKSAILYGFLRDDLTLFIIVLSVMIQKTHIFIVDGGYKNKIEFTTIYIV